MSLSKARRPSSYASLFVLCSAAFAAFAGCESASPTTGSDSDSEALPAADVKDEVATPPPAPIPDPCGIAPACDPSIDDHSFPVSPSLVVTRNTESFPGTADAPILDENFPLVDVVNQLIAQAGASESADEWLQRLWDTQNKSPGVFTEPFQPHCDDAGATINGFPVDCERNEGALAHVVKTGDFTPIAVFNRFDLAPLDGTHCGEYRIIYAMNPEAGGVTGRNFIIFEGQLPNPNPGCGIEACRPVEQFWRDLATLPDPSAVGHELRRFYFKGIDGFTPVVEVHHYGFNDGKSVAEGGYGSSGGQIRTNQFVNGPNPTAWELREFHTDVQCDGGVCKLYSKPVSVKNNPFFQLFDVASTNPFAPAFQGTFTAPSGASQVSSLAVTDPNVVTNLSTIAMNIDDQFNAGQSFSDSPLEAYPPQFAPGPDPFHDAVSIELSSIGSGLTPEEIVERAQTQSCAGCHETSNGHSVGGGLTWPQSNKFTHVNEDGTRSQALRCVFLPHRQSVGIGFLQSCGTAPDPVIPGDVDCGAFGGDGKVVVPPGKIVVNPAAGKASAPNQKKTLGGGSAIN
ncbi:MAG: hypothetical protein U0441_27040 [Polyangiaceae bacterium]